MDNTYRCPRCFEVYNTGGAFTHVCAFQKSKIENIVPMEVGIGAIDVKATLAQERYELIVKAALRFIDSSFVTNNSSLSVLIDNAHRIADEILQHHPLYPTKEKGEE